MYKHRIRRIYRRPCGGGGEEQGSFIPGDLLRMPYVISDLFSGGFKQQQPCLTFYIILFSVYEYSNHKFTVSTRNSHV